MKLSFIQVTGYKKIDALSRILESIEFDAVLIFVRTKNATIDLAEKLEARGYACEALNGDIAQKMRERTIERLKSKKIDIVIATDVAARGLHIPAVSHVINYDLPQDAEDYVHRIGRTARAGAAGDAISFGCETYAMSLPDIEDYIGHKIPVANYDVSLLPELVKPKYSARDRGRKGSNRGGKKGPSRRKRPPRKS